MLSRYGYIIVFVISFILPSSVNALSRVADNICSTDVRAELVNSAATWPFRFHIGYRENLNGNIDVVFASGNGFSAFNGRNEMGRLNLQGGVGTPRGNQIYFSFPNEFISIIVDKNDGQVVHIERLGIRLENLSKTQVRCRN